MCYRCDVCRRVVPHGTPRRSWAVLRGEGTIARELPVCGSCEHALKEGVPLRDLLRRRHSQVEGREVVTVGRPSPEPSPIPSPPLTDGRLNAGRSARGKVNLTRPEPEAGPVKNRNRKS